MKRPLYLSIAAGLIAASFVSGDSAQARPDPSKLENIKSYCLDFNWQPTKRRGRGFAKPGTWANADPAEHVAWYKAMGANTAGTFFQEKWYDAAATTHDISISHNGKCQVTVATHVICSNEQLV